MLSNVIQEVMKAMEKRSGSSNFASKALFALKNQLRNVWIVNTGASNYMTCSRCILDDVVTLLSLIRIGLPDGILNVVIDAGRLHILLDIMLDELLIVPDFKNNLLFVSKLLEQIL